MGAEYTCFHAAVLVSQLPATSRLSIAEHPALEWDTQTYLLSHIEHDLRVIAWQRTEDAAHKRNYPEHLKTPADRERERIEAESATPEYMKAVADALGIPDDRRI